MKAVAFANNDITIVAWEYDGKIADCLGFAIYRIDLNSRLTTVLPAWVGFQGQKNPNWQMKNTEIWPVQKFNWRDLTAERGGFYQYRVVPMVGSPNSLQPHSDPSYSLLTNPVHLTPNRGEIFSYFNRGILSTQSVSHQLPIGPSGAPNYRKLIDRIDQLRDPLRMSLAGDMIDALMLLLSRARDEGGECYCALYELSDPELKQILIGASFVHIILSNTGPDDATNASARQALHESNVDITDRMLPGDHIGHNKFVVYVDSKGKPQAVLAGSTNWTATGLCAQSNNSLIIESADVAAVYFDYWQRLKADQAEQGAVFRKRNNQPHELTVDEERTRVTVWFSPNTKAKSKPAQDPATPADLQQVFEIIAGATQAVLFLTFQPGTPSIVEAVAKRQKENPDLFVRGAATDPHVVENYDVQLYHHSAAKPDGTVVAATAITDQFSFWQQELLKSSPSAHAIIHDKIVVVDPLCDNCHVITGSHNLGYKASYGNDENLLIIKGNRPLAEAYATHVMDVYDHYRWRYMLQTKGNNAWTGLVPRDNWQEKYFDNASQGHKEIKFWCS